MIKKTTIAIVIAIISNSVIAETLSPSRNGISVAQVEKNNDGVKNTANRMTIEELLGRKMAEESKKINEIGAKDVVIKKLSETEYLIGASKIILKKNCPIEEVKKTLLGMSGSEVSGEIKAQASKTEVKKEKKAGFVPQIETTLYQYLFEAKIDCGVLQQIVIADQDYVLGDGAILFFDKGMNSRGIESVIVKGRKKVTF